MARDGRAKAATLGAVRPVGIYGRWIKICTEMANQFGQYHPLRSTHRINNKVATNLDKVVVGIEHGALLEEDRIGAFRIPLEIQGNRIQPRVQVAVEVCDKFLLVFRVFGFFSTNRFVDSILQECPETVNSGDLAVAMENSRVYPPHS